MKSALREYKTGINRAKLEHRRLFVHKLRKHKHTNSRNYWKLLGEKKKNKTNIPLNLLKDHFEKVNKNTTDDSVDFDEIDFNSNLPDWYNDSISKDEIMKAIKELKCNKAHGIDGVLNEYIKYTADLMINIWVKLFNRILDSGEIPSDWSTGIIITLNKGKGSQLDPNNYRGITLLSCVGKLFTSILNNRLNAFLNVYGVLNENQAGFRKMYSTTHHIFTLKCLIDLCKFRKRKLFCAYVDYERAFDKINRIALWHKLIQSNISGKLLNVIKSMYANIKSCVSNDGMMSDFFSSGVGVRQGENLSPILIALFVNDLKNFFELNDCRGIDIYFDASIDMYFKIMMLLYADDTVILAETALDLQHSLNCLYEYSSLWKLNVNRSKTKIVIFGSNTRSIRNEYIFYYNGEL